MKHPVKIILLFLLTCMSFSSQANKKFTTLSVDDEQVNQWNDFVDNLYQAHLLLMKNNNTYTKELLGGYGGIVNNDSFYKEISYFQHGTNKLLSRIQWEMARPDLIHSIEIYIYDKKGNVKSDYYARYLPQGRNAPIQTLINLHGYDDKLHGFRQFDASGMLIYETCRGTFFNEKINLHLDDEEITEFRTQSDDELLNEAYANCFRSVPKTADEHLTPLHRINNIYTQKNTSSLNINQLNQAIWSEPGNATLYLKRGDLFFQLRQFDKSIKDYTYAITLQPDLYQAYFGRGMALARNGEVQQGIHDLSFYIKHNPDDSHAYTKRGVRYIWAGNLDKAQQDLLKAIDIDIKNAEAHDDLGVLYAQKKQYSMSLKHFNYAIQYDPSYQKAYHNQSMVYFVTNKPDKALNAINIALSLDSENKNSLLLKSEILKAMGQTQQANHVLQKAEFLPEGNWSERFSIQQ